MELIRKIRGSDSRIKIVILSCLDEFRLVQQAMELGVSSYILKLTAGIAEIEQTIRNVKAVLDEEARAAAPLEWLNLAIVREQVMENYLFDQTLPTADFENCVRQLPLRLAPENLRVVMFRLPSGGRLSPCRQDPSGRPLRRFVLDLLGEVLAKFPFGECCGDSQTEYCLLLSFPGMSPAEAERWTGEVLQAVRETLLKCSWLIKKHNKTGQGQPAPPLFRTANAAIKIWSSNKKCYCSKFLYSFVIVL